ncbi:MAG: hypothetical protein AB7V08_03915 [Elusimicrobiales bacterium]
MQKDIHHALGIEADIIAERRKLINRFKAALQNLDRIFSYEHGIHGNYNPYILNNTLFELGESLNLHNRLQSLIPSPSTKPDFKNALLIMQTIANHLKDYQKDIFRTLNAHILAAFSHATIDVGYSYQGGVFLQTSSGVLEPLFTDPFQWLNKLPDAHSRFKGAWEYFLRGRHADAITNAYSALEGAALFILKSDKRLDTDETRSRLCEALSLEADWGKILFNYCKIAHAFSSRHSGKTQIPRDSIKPEIVEFYLYQTGVILRLIAKTYPHK